uniref:Ankyrin repeat protein n=1 Tax=Meloidogyne hapla TaxID=6305 RepID=A0A1I8BZZ6_MELHA
MELIIRLLLSTCKNEYHLEQAIEKCIIMKKNELAIYYLLNNDKTINNSKYSKEDLLKFNAFRACLLSANFDSENSKCLVKLTATNLIASNFISGFNRSYVHKATVIGSGGALLLATKCGKDVILVGQLKSNGTYSRRRPSSEAKFIEQKRKLSNSLCQNRKDKEENNSIFHRNK